MTISPAPARSRVEIDLFAVRHNAARLIGLLGDAELWAVLKADGYGHGAAEVGRAALEAGVQALCVATVGEGERLRAAFPEKRLIVLGPTRDGEIARARAARLEVTSVDGGVPEGVPVHMKLDTGMGRWGARHLGELPANVVGLMSHFATADTDTAFARDQLRRFLDWTSGLRIPRHMANSAGLLALPESHLDAARAGIALYGLSPFGRDPAEHGLRPALAWRSSLVQVKRLSPGQSTGYGRGFVASQPTWIGLTPVGYADGFRRGLTGTSVLVEGVRCPVVGAISMDCFAVELPTELPPGTPVTLIGDGLLAEEHASHLATITYELVSGICSGADRAERVASG